MKRVDKINDELTRLKGLASRVDDPSLARFAVASYDALAWVVGHIDNPPSDIVMERLKTLTDEAAALAGAQETVEDALREAFDEVRETLADPGLRIGRA